MRSLFVFDLQTLFPIDNTIHQQNNKMKVQDVKKECLATVGLSIEFSNSEVNSIDRLLIDVNAAVEKANGCCISLRATTLATCLMRLSVNMNRILSLLTMLLIQTAITLRW